MEDSLIEKFDKSRYRLIKWSTVGWMVWYGTFIAKDVINNKPILLLLVLVGLVGSVLWSINLVQLLRLGKKISVNPELTEAMNNEMQKFYVLKSSNIAFAATMATVGIFIGITAFYKISALIVCESILFVGISSGLIAYLTYNKE
ncbi:MAG: hypothetical protein ACK47E_00765 [Cyclobacteriaceae bacterium]